MCLIFKCTIVISLSDTIVNVANLLTSLYHNRFVVQGDIVHFILLGSWPSGDRNTYKMPGFFDQSVFSYNYIFGEFSYRMSDIGKWMTGNYPIAPRYEKTNLPWNGKLIFFYNMYRIIPNGKNKFFS